MEKKGFFPHLFNMQDHQEYVGPILDIAYYDPEGMSAKKRQEFETWYATQLQEEVNFNLKEELIAYCKSDVALLKAGCQVCVLKPVVLHHYVRAEYEVYHKTMRATDAHTTDHSKATLDWLTLAPFQPRGGSTATVSGER